MYHKQLSPKVALFISESIETNKAAIDVKSFHLSLFPLDIPLPLKVSNTKVDTDNWFAFSKNAVTPPTKYLLSRQSDNYFLEKISNNPVTEKITGGVLCMNAGSLNNYYHWLVQTILSIVGLKEQINLPAPLLLSQKLSRYQHEWLDIIGIDRTEILAFCRRSTVEVETLYILPTIYKPFDYMPCISLISAIRNLVYSKYSMEQNCSKVFSKIYISRSDSRKQRGIYSECALEDLLVNHGFVIIKLSEHSVLEQLKIISSADIIVAPHGAGLANIIFAKPTCKVVELNSEDYINTCFSRIWEAMASSSGNYNHLVCKKYDNNDLISPSSLDRHSTKSVVNFQEILEII